MAENWLSTPKNVTAGGWILNTWKYYTEPPIPATLIAGNMPINCGYACMIGEGNKYLCNASQFFIKFDISSLAGKTLSYAYLYLYIDNGTDIGDRGSPDVRVSYRSTYDADKFPWADLTVSDGNATDFYGFGANYTQIGVPAHAVTSMGADLANIANKSNIGWFKLDVQTALQDAIGKSWQWFAIRLYSSWQYPEYGWIGNYDTPPAIIQKLYVFGGKLLDTDTSYLAEFPDTYPKKCPWLRVETTSGQPPQPEPGETTDPSNVLCVACDSKSAFALAGTESGNLWKTYAGFTWYKVYSFGASVTAVYIDIKFNYVDYPDKQVFWVGLSNGDVYRSIDSGLSWKLITNVQDSIIDIKGSDVDSLKVVVGTGNYLWMTQDGGSNWASKSYLQMVGA